jgi:hypothetical protein
MGTNKECIEQLDRMKLGMADRLRNLEETLNRLSNVLLANQEPPNQTNTVMATMGDDLLSPLRQRGLNLQDFQDMI